MPKLRVCLQVVADQMRLWQAQTRRLQTHSAQLYARFETKRVSSPVKMCTVRAQLG